ncbi:hypothetical protein RB594_002329 [Gaeumannomyces avenae]
MGLGNGITLLVASIQEWTFSNPASDFIRTNRASVQLAIQVLSALLALIHSIAATKMALNVLMLYVILASLVTSLSIVSAAFWVGVMTPVEGRAFSNGTIAIPSFANLSLMGDSLIASAASATTIDGSVRRSSKIDNTQFVYVGRSYGTGAAVGIRDKDISEAYFPAGRPTSYQYLETSYNISASCGYNASADLRIGKANPAFPWVYPARGRLPDSTIEEYSSYFGMTPKAIIAMGCEMEFRPARFNVTVGLTNRTISVSNPAQDGHGRGEVAETDPPGLVTQILIRQFELIANDMTNLCESVVASALLTSARAWKLYRNSTDEAEYTLRGVGNSLIAMADDMLALYGAAQLMVGNFEQRTTVGVTPSVLKLGVWQYALAAAALNAAVVVAVVVEVVKTSGWRAMPSFDFADMGWLLPAAFRGGSLDMGGNRRGSHDEFEAVAWKGEGLSLLAGETQDIVVQLQQNGGHGHDTLLIINGAPALVGFPVLVYLFSSRDNMRHLSVVYALAALLAVNEATAAALAVDGSGRAPNLRDERRSAGQAGSGNSRCELIGRNSHYIFLDSWGPSENGTTAPACAVGLREQLVARCCKHVNNWECRAGGGDAAPGLHVAFTFGIFCKRPEHCVEDSILAAAPTDWGETVILCE